MNRWIDERMIVARSMTEVEDSYLSPELLGSACLAEVCCQKATLKRIESRPFKKFSSNVALSLSRLSIPQFVITFSIRSLM